jgi:glycosyltransferase involved in cell wall biosynthesis
MRALLAAIDRRAAGIVAATPTIASRYANERTVVVGNEARLDDFVSCAPSFDRREVLFTGAVSSAHLFQEVVAAVMRLPDVTLSVAGRDPDPVTWKDAVSRLGDRIRHLGWLDRQGLCRAIDRSSLGFATYVDTTAYAEAAPTKLFEFCAAGLPVVASPNGSNTRYIREGGSGFLSEGFDAQSLARAIDRALSDRDAWEVASAKGREWARREGSWEASERRLLDLYQQILGV